MAYADEVNLTHTSADEMHSHAECGLAYAIDMIGDRATLLILRACLFGVNKFDSICAETGCPRTIVSGRLKKLTQLGLLAYRPYKEAGQRTRRQYVLTQKGIDLALPMLALMQWGNEARGDVGSDSGLVARKTGRPARIGVISDDDRPIAIGDVQFRVSE